jgi:hypothetical protein
MSDSASPAEGIGREMIVKKLHSEIPMSTETVKNDVIPETYTIQHKSPVERGWRVYQKGFLNRDQAIRLARIRDYEIFSGRIKSTRLKIRVVDKLGFILWPAGRVEL